MILDVNDFPTEEELLARRDSLDPFRADWRRSHQCAVCRGTLVEKVEASAVDVEIAAQLYLRAGDLLCFACRDACLGLNLPWGRC